MQDRQSFIPRFLSLVTFYNSITLHDNTATLYVIIILYDNLIILHNFINKTSQIFTI